MKNFQRRKMYKIRMKQEEKMWVEAEETKNRSYYTASHNYSKLNQTAQSTFHMKLASDTLRRNRSQERLNRVADEVK